MSKEALLNAYGDQLARRKTVYHGTHDGRQYVEMRQDCAPIVEAAKIVSERVPDKEFTHVAFIPEAVMNQAFVEGWFHDPEAWKRWANNPENRDFRTHGKRL
jgi:hypothetical protein